jgi:hypothetical protein
MLELSTIIISVIASILTIAIATWLVKKILALIFFVIGWIIKTAFKIVLLPLRLILAPFIR